MTVFQAISTLFPLVPKFPALSHAKLIALFIPVAVNPVGLSGALPPPPALPVPPSLRPPASEPSFLFFAPIL